MKKFDANDNSARLNLTNAADVKERNLIYGKYVNAVSPHTKPFRSLLHSFLIGGAVCVFAELLLLLFKKIIPSLDELMLAHLTVVVLIALSVLLTGIGIFDVAARKGGAGVFLPITGFANAMASASMEHKAEGLIMGTSTKLFSVVGPVLVNGIVWSAVIALIRLAIGFA